MNLSVVEKHIKNTNLAVATENHSNFDLSKNIGNIIIIKSITYIP